MAKEEADQQRHPQNGSIWREKIAWSLLAISLFLHYVYARRGWIDMGTYETRKDLHPTLSDRAANSNLVLPWEGGPLEVEGFCETLCSGAVVTGNHHESDFSEKDQNDALEALDRRLSSSGGAGAGNDYCASSSDHDVPNQYDALLFMFNALVIGSAVMQASSILPWLPQTVVLFVLGLAFALVMEISHASNSTGVFGVSYKMWMCIDPHLLLFTFIPALLAGDAMRLDTSVGLRVGYQCAYLAGPGVFLQAIAVAIFLYYYLGWSFLLSLVTSSILCATDPVAVVALLKDLGAPPTLTVQIQGESLLNDGTAMVLYQIAYHMLSGEEYDAAKIVMFLVEYAFMACALGMFVGYMFFTWIRVANNRLNNLSSMIQISLTLCSAYWSFIMAEGVLKISGVLATVASSLVLAHHMWPHVASPESLHNVWQTFESLGNILIFFLAGALTGKTMVTIDPINFLHLFVIYIVLLVIRFSMIFFSRPLLKCLSYDNMEVTLADTCIMTWAGLRGAVGLCMAIMVHNDQAPNKDGELQVSDENAKRVLFFVSGIAFLSMIINATSCSHLVNWMGITVLPEAQLRLLRMLNRELVYRSEGQENPPEVTSALSEMMNEIDAKINLQKVVAEDGSTSTSTSRESIRRRSRRPTEDEIPSSEPIVAAEEEILRQESPEETEHISKDVPLRAESDVHVANGLPDTTVHQPDNTDGDATVVQTTDHKEGSPKISEITQGSNSPRTDPGSPCSRTRSLRSRATTRRMSTAMEFILNHAPHPHPFSECETNSALVLQLSEAETRYRALLSTEGVEMMSRESNAGGVSKGIQSDNILLQVDNHVKNIVDLDVDVGMAKVVNKAFLSLVRTHYLRQIESGDLRPGSEEAKLLLTSVEVALSPLQADLVDLKFVLQRLSMRVSILESALDWWDATPVEDKSSSKRGSRQAAEEQNHTSKNSYLTKLVASAPFHIGVASAIVFNVIYLVIEENLRNPQNSSDIAWILFEAFFQLIFTFEFCLKLTVMRLRYWKDTHNVFDFILVVLGMFGLATSILERNTARSGASDTAGLFRIARVFRLLRFLRVFRILHAKIRAEKNVSLELAAHMFRIAVFMSFIGAHLASQVSLLKYFGRGGKMEEEDAEISRCIIQSQVHVYSAIEMAVIDLKETSQMQSLEELKWLYERKEIIEGLEEFVMSAYRDGAIGPKDAESIMHPLQHQIQQCLAVLHACQEGITNREGTLSDSSIQENGSNGVRRQNSSGRKQTTKNTLDSKAGDIENLADKGHSQSSKSTDTKTAWASGLSKNGHAAPSKLREAADSGES